MGRKNARGRKRYKLEEHMHTHVFFVSMSDKNEVHRKPPVIVRTPPRREVTIIVPTCSRGPSTRRDLHGRVAGTCRAGESSWCACVSIRPTSFCATLHTSRCMCLT